MERWIFDFETTGAQRDKGSPFNPENVACCVGFRNIDTKETRIYELQYGDKPYGEQLQEIQTLLSTVTLLVGFNIKFDLHWLNRYGFKLPDTIRIFDCQNAHFILTAQQNTYPSLDGVAEYYGLEKKLDIVKTEYWDKGLDTNEVPWNVLSDYLEQDLVVTGNVFHSTQEDIKQSSYEMQRLISVANQDLLVLTEMEENGILYDKEKSIKKGNKLENEINGIDEQLKILFKADWFNISSRDHLSVLLYGGTLYFDGKEDFIFTYKDGTTKDKQRNVKVPTTFKGLFKPLEKSAVKKEGFYATNEATLKVLLETAKGEPKKILELLLTRAKIEKIRGTYFHGFPKRIEESNWQDNIIHTNFSQVTAVSGRLASSKPNVQNTPPSVDECFISRFSCLLN